MNIISAIANAVNDRMGYSCYFRITVVDNLHSLLYRMSNRWSNSSFSEFLVLTYKDGIIEIHNSPNIKISISDPTVDVVALAIAKIDEIHRMMNPSFRSRSELAY